MCRPRLSFFQAKTKENKQSFSQMTQKGLGVGLFAGNDKLKFILAQGLHFFLNQ